MNANLKLKAWDKELKVFHNEVSLIDFTSTDCAVIFYDAEGMSPLTWYPRDRFILIYPVGLQDRDKKEIYDGDITEMIVFGETRRFHVKMTTVYRNIKSLAGFEGEYAAVAITGVVFEWNGHALFPCVDINGVPDNERMKVIGHILSHPELLVSKKE
jgi:hypothetical protein